MDQAMKRNVRTEVAKWLERQEGQSTAWDTCPYGHWMLQRLIECSASMGEARVILSVLCQHLRAEYRVHDDPAGAAGLRVVEQWIEGESYSSIALEEASYAAQAAQSSQALLAAWDLSAAAREQSDAIDGALRRATRLWESNDSDAITSAAADVARTALEIDVDLDAWRTAWARLVDSWRPGLALAAIDVIRWAVDAEPHEEWAIVAEVVGDASTWVTLAGDRIAKMTASVGAPAAEAQQRSADGDARLADLLRERWPEPPAI